MHAGHVQVQQDQVQVVILTGNVESAVQIVGFDDLAALKARGDNAADGFAEQWVVVGNQNLVSRLHGWVYLFVFSIGYLFRIMIAVFGSMMAVFGRECGIELVQHGGLLCRESPESVPILCLLL